MNTTLNRNGSSWTPRWRAASTTTGVRKTTAVSRFSTAVTALTSSMLTSSTEAAEPGSRSSRRPARANRPSAWAASPTSSRPVTSTKAGQTCSRVLVIRTGQRRSGGRRGARRGAGIGAIRRGVGIGAIATRIGRSVTGRRASAMARRCTRSGTFRSRLQSSEPPKLAGTRGRTRHAAGRRSRP